MSRENTVLKMIGNPWWHEQSSSFPSKKKKVDLSSPSSIISLHPSIPSYKIKELHNTQMCLVPGLRLRYSYPRFASSRWRQGRSTTGHKWHGLAVQPRHLDLGLLGVQHCAIQQAYQGSRRSADWKCARQSPQPPVAEFKVGLMNDG